MSVTPTESPSRGLPMASGLPGAELPVVDAPRRERADAVRNREALLEAARRLLGQCGPDGITMDAVAAEAGVGKGTLFRRFGDRASLFRTLIDDRERAFQEALIRGPVPLGPGAPTRERLIAFGHAMLELIEDHGPLMAAAMPGSRALQYDHPVYIAYRTHVMSLLSELCGERRAPYLAAVLLAALDPELVMYQRTVLGLERDELEAGWAELVRSL
ncbi:MAG: TetR/AcrR family transcriptional regulator [Solirubrobacteraceae bacterium]